MRISPYAALVLKTLKLVVPIAGALAGVEMTEEQFKQAQREVDLMKALVDKLPAQLNDEELELSQDQPAGQLTSAEGAALRGLRALLLEHDPMRAFGDLRRVQAPSGDFLWVCNIHYPEYDPGLPIVPGSEPGTARSP